MEKFLGSTSSDYNFFFPALQRYNLHIKMYNFKLYKGMFRYMYIL